MRPPVRIDDPDDPRLGAYLGIRTPAVLAQRGLFVAESRHVVRKLLASRRFPVRSLWATARAIDSLQPEIEAHDGDFEVFTSPRALFSEVAGYSVHHGCLAIASRGEARDAMSLAARTGLLVCSERLANPDNLGGIFRNAQAFGAGAVWLAPGGADPYYRKVLRVSTGASLVVPFATAADWPTDLEKLQAEGFTVLAAVADEADAIEVDRFVRERGRPSRVCLVFGAEDEGLSAASRRIADARITIPTAPGFDSLNVATASGILLHHFASLP